MRRTQVFTANIARMASVTPRTLGSGKVANANAAKATYAANASTNLFATTKFMVHREGFEPSYLARRSRFTVCRL